MPKVGVILSGCGVYDGAEIHESVAAILALDRAGAEILYMAPDVPQMHVINHIAGEPADGESRSVLVESARIARGDIKNIAGITAADIDALIIPGGFGAAKNLCDFAVKGADCTVNTDVSRLVLEMHSAAKPVGFICIAPALAAKIYGRAGIEGVKLTIGSDKETAGAIEAMGAKHVNCEVRDCVVDADHKVVTTPAYMLATRINEVADGIEKLVYEVLKLA
ncbi:MAG TPA: isoprenoid biosynthesis glyoxalase ElbB [Acidobacteriota bacterium]|nr:isoprenoid biosynthesis glyoxalase ElbB [Acidobacteriota bacterium]